MCHLSTIESAPVAPSTGVDAAAVADLAEVPQTPSDVTTWMGILLRCFAFLLAMVAPATSLAAVGSCRLWRIQPSSTNDSRSINLGDISPAYTSLLLSESDESLTLQSSTTFGLFAWNPEQRGCRWYNSNSNGFLDDNTLPKLFTVARIMALLTAVVTIFALANVAIEVFCCRYTASRLLSIALIVVAALIHATTVALYMSNLCWDDSSSSSGPLSYTCTNDQGTRLALVAIPFWILTLLIACMAPKRHALIRSVLDVERQGDAFSAHQVDDCQCCGCCCCDGSGLSKIFFTATRKSSSSTSVSSPMPPPYCHCFYVFALHCFRRRQQRQLRRSNSVRSKSSSGGGGWSISFQQPTDSVRMAGDVEEVKDVYADSEDDGEGSSSSSEEEVFFDVDRDFVGHEIAVPDDFDHDEELGSPPTIHEAPKNKPPPVLYPLKEPTVVRNKAPALRTETGARDPESQKGYATNVKASQPYQNGVVIDDDLFFDSIPGSSEADLDLDLDESTSSDEREAPNDA